MNQGGSKEPKSPALYMSSSISDTETPSLSRSICTFRNACRCNPSALILSSLFLLSSHACPKPSSLLNRSCSNLCILSAFALNLSFAILTRSSRYSSLTIRVMCSSFSAPSSYSCVRFGMSPTNDSKARPAVRIATIGKA